MCLQVPGFRDIGRFCRIQHQVAATEKIKFQDEVVANIPSSPHSLAILEEKEEEGINEKWMMVRNGTGYDTGGCVGRQAAQALKNHSIVSVNGRREGMTQSSGNVDSFGVSSKLLVF